MYTTEELNDNSAEEIINEINYNDSMVALEYKGSLIGCINHEYVEEILDYLNTEYCKRHRTPGCMGD